MKDYFILTFEEGSPYSESISKGLLVSKNENALLSIARRLKVFCKEDQYFQVNHIIGSWIKDNEYTVVREEISECDFYRCEDLYEKEDLIDLNNLTNDQDIIKIPVVDNYTKETINHIATEIFGKHFIRNDYLKAISYWSNVDKGMYQRSLIHDF